MAAGVSSSEVVFRAFLSHRYKSPEVNEYFFQWFAAAEANPQFAVDQGTIATSVTRLERLIRGADAFIGIYPFPDDVEATSDRAWRESRYFRLELDLAERAAKPALAFIDSRFGSVIVPPPPIIQVRFRREEILLHAPSPRADEFRRRVEDFCQWVAGWRVYQSSHMPEEEKIKVGILLPPEDSSGAGYTKRHIELIAAAIGKSPSPRDVDVMEWPPMLGSALAAKLQALDWIVADIGGASAVSGIVGYLHGRFIPTLRLMQIPAGIPLGQSTPLIETLFGGHEVGYPKDIVGWSDEETLQTEVEKRIEILHARQKSVATVSEAQEYFRSAALRNEAIFVSFSGEDEEVAEELTAALRQRFQEVFNYRDGKSIPGGSPWMEEIFAQIAARPVGVLLYSPSYFKSGNCLHEARAMLARRDRGEMKVVPVKLHQGKLEMPAEFDDVQYLRKWLYPDPAALVDSIIQAIGS
jgi:hypothetical protein